MIDFNEAIIRNISVQKFSIEQTSKKPIAYLYETANEEEEQVFRKMFAKPFVSNIVTYEFTHEVDIELNVLHKLSKDIRKEENFAKASVNIHQHLQSVSKHPNIKDGELFIVKFEEVRMDNSFYEALGIYKIENKESFIETDFSNNNFSIDLKKGISGRKVDKACLVLFTQEPFIVFVVDNNSIDTEYWKNEFLKIKYKNDSVNNTSHFLSLTKSFVTEQLPGQYNLSKANQAEFLNRSVNYFRENETFDIKEFQNTVFEDIEYIKSFQKYGSQYADENGIDIAAKFEIFGEAVKKQEKIFKSVLKLDKNFHIYIHGRTDLIEKGSDKNGKFYKIYYKEES